METLKEKILELKFDGKSHKEIAKILECSLSSVVYHCKEYPELKILPNALYNKIDPKTQELIIIMFSECGMNCKEIGEILKLPKNQIKSFYARKLNGTIKRKSVSNSSSYGCVKRRRKRLKLLGVLYLGGKCSVCGFCDDICVLEFHHTRDKKFTISQKGNSSWDAWKKELDKCILLCSNCHQQQHSSENEAFNKALKCFNTISGILP